MKPAGRLAFRREGIYWVCYFAQLGTMDDASEIGRIIHRIIEADPMLRLKFMEVCKEALSVACRESLGAEPEWPFPAERIPDDQAR